jgi:hypothetical protein
MSMPLVPVLRLVSLNEENASIVVADATGNYSGSNPGGYGAPNPAIASIQAVILQLASLSNLSQYSVVREEDTTALFSADGYEIGGGLADGVYDLKYGVAFSLLPITIVPGTKEFQLASADTILAGASGIVLQTVDEKKIYYIDQTRALSGTGGFVTSVFPSDAVANQVNNLVVYENNLKVLVSTKGNDCLNRDIATWSDNGCEGIDYKDVWKRYQMKVAMEIKFTSGLLADADNFARKLQAYCSPNTIGCGC